MRGHEKAIYDCETKNAYSCELKARTEGMKMVVRVGSTLWPYRCDICNGWHLTSGKKGCKPITADNSGAW